jgi:hypothetical protein
LEDAAARGGHVFASFLIITTVATFPLRVIDWLDGKEHPSDAAVTLGNTESIMRKVLRPTGPKLQTSLRSYRF